jgi:hypothetical protein
MYFRWCAWCGKFMGVRLAWPLWHIDRTHGICRKCKKGF